MDSQKSPSLAEGDLGGGSVKNTARHCEQGEALRGNPQSLKWREFKIGELFDISTPKKKFNANTITFDGTYPYVARGEKNNGIRGYINEDTQFLNEANTISFGQDTATMFWQEKPYFTGDKIKIFSPKNFALNRHNANFLIPSLKKAFSLFSWGSSSFEVSVLENVKIQLPTNENGQIAFDFMEIFIKAVEKEVIKNVVLWNEKNIQAHKDIIESKT